MATQQGYAALNTSTAANFLVEFDDYEEIKLQYKVCVAYINLHHLIIIEQYIFLIYSLRFKTIVDSK